MLKKEFVVLGPRTTRTYVFYMSFNYYTLRYVRYAYIHT